MSANNIGRFAGRLAHTLNKIAGAAEKGYNQASDYTRDVAGAVHEYAKDPAGLKQDVSSAAKEAQQLVDMTWQRFIGSLALLFAALVVSALPSQHTGLLYATVLWLQWLTILVLGIAATMTLLNVMFAYRPSRIVAISSIIADRVAKPESWADRAARVFTTFTFAPAFFAVAFTAYLLIVPFRFSPFAAVFALLTFATIVLAVLWNPKMNWVYNIPAVLFVVATVLPFISWAGNTIQEQRAVEHAENQIQAVAQRESAVAAQERIEATRSAIQGTWRIVDGWDSTVYVGDYQVDRLGTLTSFEFQYSFFYEGKNHANTWQCYRSQHDRYNCTYRQRWDGGSLRGEAVLERTSNDSFSGRFLYQNEWTEITFRKKGV